MLADTMFIEAPEKPSRRGIDLLTKYVTGCVPGARVILYCKRCKRKIFRNMIEASEEENVFIGTCVKSHKTRFEVTK